MSHTEIDQLVQDLVMTDDDAAKERVAQAIAGMAKEKNIFLSSIHDVYIARGRNEGPKFTVPAMNLRCLTYDLARAVFRVAKAMDGGAFIFEIAKSEMGYTDQKPIEYTAVVLAAAVKEGHQGPVFIQGDHCQIKAKSYFEDPRKEVESLKNLIGDAVAAGFYNIDVDSSTTVVLDRKTIKEQQRDNFSICADVTKFIRRIQPKGIMVSVGGEIGEVGGKNSTVEELQGFMDGYLESLSNGDVGISKISVQTGTSHGGVVLPDGSIADVNVDFNTLEKLSAEAKQKYHLGGAVQHGASTLPPEAFDKFPQIDTIEIHLATNFQNMVFESQKFPKELRDKMYAWVHKNCANEKKEGQTEEQFIYKTRKKALGPFKKEIMGLPAAVREDIAKEVEVVFKQLFTKLSVGKTKEFVNSVIKPVDVEIGLNKQSTTVLDGEGDD